MYKLPLDKKIKIVNADYLRFGTIILMTVSTFQLLLFILGIQLTSQKWVQLKT